MLSRAAHALAAVQRCAAADMRYSFQRGLRCAGTLCCVSA